MNRLVCLVVAAVLTGWILAACGGPQQAPAQPGPGAPVTPTRAAKEGWQVEWEKLVEAGKKEGTVSVYAGNWLADVQTALRNKARENFGLNLEFTNVSGGAELVVKMEKERNAGLYLADVIGSGLPTTTTLMKPKGMLAPLQPVLVLPEVKDTKVQLAGRLFLDTDQKYHIPLSSAFDPLVTRNTEMVKDGEIKSFYDVLEPRWKGKIVINDPTNIGGGNRLVTLLLGQLGPDKGRDYFVQLVKQEPLVSRDYRLMAEWLARGKVALGLGVPIGNLMPFKREGAPVAFVRVKEGGTVSQAGPYGIALPAGSLPHPNAARVFINWVLTKEGQTALSKAASQPAWRLDVPTEGLEDFVPPPGSAVEDEAVAQEHQRTREIAKEIFAPLLR